MKISTLVIVFVLGCIVGAIAHEVDMHNEYVKEGTLTRTSWVTRW